jgi:hypothetical protein
MCSGEAESGKPRLSLNLRPEAGIAE